VKILGASSSLTPKKGKLKREMQETSKKITTNCRRYRLCEPELESQK